jgi:hypothetical protein
MFIFGGDKWMGCLVGNEIAVTNFFLSLLRKIQAALAAAI